MWLKARCLAALEGRLSDQMTADVNSDYPDFEGTPSFIINGKLLSKTGSWDQLKPQLDAALK